MQDVEGKSAAVATEGGEQEAKGDAEQAGHEMVELSSEGGEQEAKGDAEPAEHEMVALSEGDEQEAKGDAKPEMVELSEEQQYNSMRHDDITIENDNLKRTLCCADKLVSEVLPWSLTWC